MAVGEVKKIESTCFGHMESKTEKTEWRVEGGRENSIWAFRHFFFKRNTQSYRKNRVRVKLAKIGAIKYEVHVQYMYVHGGHERQVFE